MQMKDNDKASRSLELLLLAIHGSREVKNSR